MDTEIVVADTDDQAWQFADALGPKKNHGSVVGPVANRLAGGEAPIGVVYATDARLSDRVTIAARFPASTHTPIRYHFTIVRGRGTPTVRALFARLTDADARSVFDAHGFHVAPADGRARAQ